jgi:hypothetical protein
MARKGLFSRGPFLMGLTMLVFGALAFATPGFLPPAQNAEAAARVGEITGMVGGGLIGVGLVAMLFGLLRWLRQA